MGGMTEKKIPRAVSSKTLRAAVLLPVAGVGSTVTARCGAAPALPPWPPPESPAAGFLPVFVQALILLCYDFCWPSSPAGGRRNCVVRAGQKRRPATPTNDNRKARRTSRQLKMLSEA